MVENRLLLHLTCDDAVEEKHRHAVANQLRGTGLELGLVLCFGSKPSFARVIADHAPMQTIVPDVLPPTDLQIVYRHDGNPTRPNSIELLHQALTERILDQFYVVYRELGYGFEECLYENAFGIVLRDGDSPFKSQRPIKIHYLGDLIGDYRADIIVDEKVLLELKAADAIEDAHIAQTLNYLKATGLEIGLILNFARGHRSKDSYSLGSYKCDTIPLSMATCSSQRALCTTRT